MLEWMTLSDGNPDGVRYSDLLYTELQAILRQKAIQTVFQPVVSLSDGSILGYEALSRGPKGSRLERPNVLFAAAKYYHLLWDLEFLCRSHALEKAREMIPQKMLFLNVDPKVIHDTRFQKGLTKEILERYRLDAVNIIFEITEKTAIEDYKSFKKTLDHYTGQGYKIALDDTGSGYSGLKLLAETHPHYVKIDMELVRNIDKDALKQALMKAFYDFSLATNMKIIAEGIETIGEMNTLIDIGIHYGQGYLLQRPVPEFLEISTQLRQAIRERNHRKGRDLFYTLLAVPIGEIAHRDRSFSPGTDGHQIIDHFNANPLIQGVPIVDGSQPVGVLMKYKFLAHLATQYGMAVYMKRPVELLMDKNPLVLDYFTPVDQVSKFALARTEESMYDYIIITRDDEYFGITSVKSLLEKISQMELTRAKHSNPLTGLPGNMLVEEELKKVVTSTGYYAVLYFDLDNFKSYNDVYGFENGDQVIQTTAQIIQKQLQRQEFSDVFLGHIGGDDFVAILHSNQVEAVCERIIQMFDAQVPGFYNEEDRRRGYIRAKNRRGQEEEFPFVSISIGVVTNRETHYRDYLQLGEAAAAVKQKCKLTWKSCYHIA